MTAWAISRIQRQDWPVVTEPGLLFNATSISRTTLFHKLHVNPLCKKVLSLLQWYTKLHPHYCHCKNSSRLAVPKLFYGCALQALELDSPTLFALATSWGYFVLVTIAVTLPWPSPLTWKAHSTHSSLPYVVKGLTLLDWPIHSSVPAGTLLSG